MKSIQHIQRLAVLAGLLSIAGAASAVDINWTNTAGGNFQTAGNWDPNSVPTTGDTATFGQTGSYTANFTAAAVSDKLSVTNSNAVTFDMAGNTNTVGTGVDGALIVTNSASLIVSSSSGGGTLVANGGGGFNNAFLVYAGSTLRIDDSLGSPVTFTSHAGSDVAGTFIVEGNGTVYDNFTAGVFWAIRTGASISVSNGARAAFNNIDTISAGAHSINVDGAGTSVTNGGGSRMIANAGTVSITGGATWRSSGQFEMGIFFGAGGLVDVGNGVGTSILSADNFQLSFSSGGDQRSFPELRVNSGGLVQDTGGDLVVYDRGKVTLNGGEIQIKNGRTLRVLDNSASTAERGLLRGVGTITLYDVGSNFSITNNGDVRPGDTSVTPAIGTLSVTDGDLVQTSGGASFFDFDPTTPGSADLIDITGGTASIGGSLTFSNLVAGPLVYGTWDFVKADSITYIGTDNMAALVSSLGLPGPADVSFGVISQGGFDILRLTVEIPEPSTVALLGFAGLLLARKRAKQSA